ncbi:hypothetical protein LPW11_06585 [Geomonas sp. RF6]|uniref:hypothetical protein n=1 Tax=Geomonas sp. RF6 TaxID=2897342 RepID=UPI001E500459|nr:hypothetical protein [Geomonas sp. RF6]UFS71855.1 hypothetical protein LPW11_06585 [Geomonas sp. RF6]
MICPKCGFEQGEGMTTCERCGVIFAKVRRSSSAASAAPPVASTAAVAGDLFGRLRGALVAVEPGEPDFFVVGRSLLFAALVFWGWRFMSATIASGYAAESMLHLTLLPFHEAGHVIFGVLGNRFLTVLGGTLGQLLVPLVVICAFLARRNPFAASVGVWWLGESFMDVAIYADDARAGELPLLGGVTGSEVEDYHDWEVMLGKLGWLQYDHLIGRIFYGCGTILILLSLAWGALLLWRQVQLRRGRPG